MTNGIKCGPGVVFFQTAAGTITPLGEVESMELSVPAEYELDPSICAPHFELQKEFSFTAKVSRTSIMRIMFESWEDKRLVHLACCARKRRTRKKNGHRLYKEYKRRTTT